MSPIPGPDTIPSPVKPRETSSSSFMKPEMVQPFTKAEEEKRRAEMIAIARQKITGAMERAQQGKKAMESAVKVTKENVLQARMNVQGKTERIVDSTQSKLSVMGQKVRQGREEFGQKLGKTEMTVEQKCKALQLRFAEKYRRLKRFATENPINDRIDSVIKIFSGNSVNQQSLRVEVGV